MLTDQSLVSLKVINPSSTLYSECPELEDTYQFWAESWRETFESLGVDSELKSDQFSRAQAALVLFYGKRPIGLCLNRDLNLKSRIWVEDSSIEAWPADALSNISENLHGNRVSICSYFTIAKDFRGRSSGEDMKSILMGLAVQHFMSGSSTYMLGTARSNRGMSSVAEDWGAKPIVEGKELHGVEVSLVLFSREACQPIMTDRVAQLWKEREEIEPAHMEEQEIHKNVA